MKLLLLTLSAAFVIYGLMPYHKATDIDTTKPNQLVIEQQECGCPCPDAVVIVGQLQIPPAIATKYQTLHTTQLNLDIRGFNEPNNYELGQAKLFIKGNVVGADTILCEPTNCELAPRFKVDSWALVDTVARAWIFPKWVKLIFITNLLLILPALSISEIVTRIKTHRRKKSSS